VYALPDGYAQTNDLDVQNAVGDELLPVTGKTDILTANIETLQGIVEYKDKTLVQFDLSGGRQTYTLLAPDGTDNFYRPSGIAFNSLLRGPIGSLELRILDVDNNVISPAEYVIVEKPSGTPAGINFTGEVPTSPKVTAYVKASASGKWALPHDEVYDGTNPSFNRVKLVVDGGAPKSVIPSGAALSYLTIAGTPTTVVASLWVKATRAQYFCGAYNNWIGDHLNMWPDVFISLIDYPGDRDTDTNGDPLPDELKPGYQAIGTYSINFRDGVVKFNDFIDTTTLNEFDQANLVRANYAHLAGIGNVTGQKLDQISGTGGKHYKATTELMFPDSHGKRWVGRNDIYTPMNIYVKGTTDTSPKLTPTPVRILPWEQLDVKTAP
jgi:hypothetical protein